MGDTGLIQSIRTAEFRLARRGYTIREVDFFLTYVISRIESGDPIRWEGTFRRSRKGYDVELVDALMASVRSRLSGGPDRVQDS